MTLATASALRRLMERLVPSPRPVLVPVRRALALGLLPLAFAPEALAQPQVPAGPRGGTAGSASGAPSGPRRDTVAVASPRTGRVATPPSAPGRVAPSRDDRTRHDPPRGGYDDVHRRIEEQRRQADEQRRQADEQRRQAEERQREAQRRVEEQRRETERRTEAQRREAEERQREAQRRAAGLGGYGNGYPAYGSDYGYGYTYGDRYWSSAWSPLLRFRQRVRVESDRRYGYGTSVLELRTHYRQRRVGSGARYGERLELQVERLDAYQDGRYLGSVDQYDLPERFRRVHATLQESGRLRLEGDLLLVGEAGVGFELIRFDGSDFYGSWRRQYDALTLDFARSRARALGWSRLFNPYDYRGYAPVSIVPDVEDDFYGGYGYDGYGQPGYDRARSGVEGPVYGEAPRSSTNGSGDVRPQPSARPQAGTVRDGSVRSPRSRVLTLPGGQQVQVQREIEIMPVEGGQ